MQATGTFEVAEFTPAAVPAGDIKTALPVGVATMRKTFTGELDGRSETLFTAAFDPVSGTGTYVAMESFEGRVAGRSGTFNFVHSAATTGHDRQAEFLTIVPGSGTAELTGIHGTGALTVDPDGTHHLRLDYEVP
ncbi:hypothetical protein Aab01nite_34520 [Paractinoplanes abujensis]|uniref:DUF3224 domain-containing protein n=1 Tax=Paractinoplanes abujensis TaxID=882441 RepID=A0A7W7CZN5_9ACTN|nr:DUF3224 domain-containing protein [Actinoplanes abujensis]MBB4697649.1 hypothetical protein [Actinoplanes abujensis]GID19862.1 hypothetical protein Aab01nite_34520 [Actinoplanes abujensis]